MDLNLCISNGKVSTKIYDKRGDFDFDLVNFPFLDGDFNCRNKALTAKLLRQCYRYFKLRKAFSKFCRRHSALVEKYNVSLKTLLQQGIWEPEFYGDLEKLWENLTFRSNSEK